MSIEQFDKLVESAISAKPGWFSELEAPATGDDVRAAEHLIGAALPEEYKHFVNTFGAGYFGQINISSLKNGSEWFRADSLLQLSDGRKFYVVTDDQTGGFYGFIVEADQCGDAIVYIHPDDGGELEVVAKSFFGFVVETALTT
jgi:hypothetical protein